MLSPKLLLLLAIFSLVACSSPTADEPTDEVHLSLGSCPRPKGTIGDATAPFNAYVSSITVVPGAAYKLRVQVTNPFNGAVSSTNIDFGGANGVAQAVFTGGGWSGTRLLRWTSYDSTEAPCLHTGNPNLVCNYFAGVDSAGNPRTGWIYMDKRVSKPWSLGGGVTSWFGSGATRFAGVESHGVNQTLRVTYDNGAGAAATIDTSFEGPRLTSCQNP